VHEQQGPAASEAPSGPEQQEETQDGGVGTESPPEEGAPALGAQMTITFGEYEELKALARERDEYLKRLQRAVADYQNLQKRIEKTRARVHAETVEEVLRHILPIADSLSLALEAADNTEGAEDMVAGLKLLEKEFYDSLQRFGVEPIEALGAQFDPHYHEAVMSEERQGVPPNTVVRELKKGFLMRDRVIRASQVSVTPARKEQEESVDLEEGAEGQQENQGT